MQVELGGDKTEPVLMILALLNLVDAWTTTWLRNRGAEEINPLSELLLRKGVFVPAKVVLSALLGFYAFIGSLDYWAFLLAYIAVMLYAGVVVSNGLEMLKAKGIYFH